MNDNEQELPQDQRDTVSQDTEEQAETAQEEPTPEQLIEALMVENADMKDKLMRTLADMENLRRRTDREKTDATKYAISSLAKDLLGIGDNLKRALESVPAEMRDTRSDETKNLIDGVELTERELHNVLGRHHINKIEARDQKFDPNFHQAMFEVENKDIPNGTVIEVVQEGYVIGERVLRPAMVGVSKGGPKAQNTADQKEDASPVAKQAAETLEQTAKNQEDAKATHNVDKNA